MEEFLWTDSESLYAKLKHQEKQLKLKRRWLMGLPLSDSEQKQLNKLEFRENKTVPESFLREDDVYYETIKAFVEKGFASCNSEREHYVDLDTVPMSELSNDVKNLFSMLDDMTNNGLLLFAELLTGGSIEFEKTRLKMKKIIREYLPEVLANCTSACETNIAEQLCQLLRNPHNFQRNRATLLTTPPQSYHAAATKVLDGLEDLPFSTLSAMHRKLRGVQGYVPQLQPQKSGWARSTLIDQVRKRCMEMLSELGEEDELQEPLAKAMAVGSLSAKLIQGCPFVPEFWKFSPEIEALQNGLAKAVWLLKEKVRFPELKNLQQLLDPTSELSSRSLRTAVKNLFTEYIFECSDMDTIPYYLVETLSIINRTSRSAPYRFLSNEEVEEDLECVLSVSAQIKQVLWDLLPDYEFDQDFTDAYMEDLEESDDGDDYSDHGIEDQQEVVLPQNNSFYSHEPYDQIETIGETNPSNSESPASPIEENFSSPVLTPNRLSSESYQRIESEQVTVSLGMDLVDSDASASSSSCSEPDVFEIMEGNQFHTGCVRNLERSDPHSLAYQSGSSSHFSPVVRLNQDHDERQEPTVDQEKPPDFVSPNFSSAGNFMHDKQSISRNQYVAVQEACDKTSIVAYRLIGYALDQFAQIEGFNLDWGDVSYLRGDSSIQKDSGVAKEDHISYEEEVHGAIIIRAVEELLPSFPESGKERVKELMNIN